MLIALPTYNNILKCHHKNSISRIHISKIDVFNCDVENQLAHRLLPKEKLSASFFKKKFKNLNCVCFFALFLFAGMSVR